MFQSTLPVAGERPLPTARLVSNSVSIHAPRCRGAMRAPQANGVYPAFQSTLPVAGERCLGIFFGLIMAMKVSIHAPRCRGAMRCAPLAQRTSVSIHAPRCRGACHQSRALGDEPLFQSTLPVAGERHRGVTSAGPAMRFNPRSPLPGSDAVDGEIHGGVRKGFNPRSPCRERCQPMPRGTVSIHAPRCRGATCESPPIVHFSIHAPLRGDRLVRLRGYRFQSTLPVAGERCAKCMQCRRGAFNPRSPLPGSEATMFGLRYGCRLSDSFQSTLPVAGERMLQPSMERRFNPRSPAGSDACWAGATCGPCFSIHAPRCRGATRSFGRL